MNIENDVTLHFFNCFIALSVFICLSPLFLSALVSLSSLFYMMSAWKFIQNDLAKSHGTENNSHLNIYFKIQHDMALSGGKIFTNKRIL